VKRWFAPLAGLVLALVAIVWMQKGLQGSPAPYPAPNFALVDLSGNTHRLSDFRGKVVFLNLWTTWCPPCRMEMPAMQALYRRMKGRDFVMLAVSSDEDGARAVAPFVKELGLSFPVLLDPAGRVSARYGISGYPETFVISREGDIIKHFIGPADWQSPAMETYFLKLLARESGSARVSRD